jgi:2'-hydroxyisoflavone reductase
MTSVLVLGGTGWLSGLIAEEWRDRGADVTALARGGRAPADGIRLAVGDRDQPDAYDEVAAERWDEVVDITMNVAHARAAVTALADRTRHWTCISTISVYADSDVIGADESAETLEPADPGSPGPAEEGYDYGRAKVAVEAAVGAGLGDRALIVRPGLIVGPGDVSDRFGYWVGRFALAADGPVLVPDLEGLGAQVIDVRDLAAFVVRAGADAVTGTIDVVGDPLVLSDVLARARGIAGHTGELVERDDEWLERHDVSHWSGPRSLPLWLPHDSAGFMSRSNRRYREAGGAIRDLDTTLRDTLADESMRGLDRERRSGLSRTEELALIADETPAAD